MTGANLNQKANQATFTDFLEKKLNIFDEFNGLMNDRADLNHDVKHKPQYRRCFFFERQNNQMQKC